MSQRDADVTIHQGDIPEGVAFGPQVAVDTETLGLNTDRDRLCLVQLSAGDGAAHIVQFAAGQYDAPRLKALMVDTTVLKIFHYARFDMAAMDRYLGAMPGPVYCTKIASRLVRTYTDRHGLKDLCREALSIELSKQVQSSDWGAERLSDEQVRYAASDVLYLHKIKAWLDERLDRENRRELAERCFAFLPTRVALDRGGWIAEDIFSH